MENSKAQQEVIDMIFDRIKDLGQQIREDQSISLQDKCEQVDILLDVNKFLMNYNENVKILNKYYLGRSKFDREK